VTVSVVDWLVAFALTCAIESAIAVPLLRAVEPRLARRLALVLFANLATHPAVWFVFPQLGLAYPLTIAIAEAWALVLEAVFYAFAFPGLGGMRALHISVLANLASFLAGVVLHALGLL
jgi:hypothetical protein